MNVVREKKICGKAFRYDELRENKEGIDQDIMRFIRIRLIFHEKPYKGFITIVRISYTVSKPKKHRKEKIRKERPREYSLTKNHFGQC